MVAYLIRAACGDKNATIEKCMPNYAPEPAPAPKKQAASIHDVLKLFGA